MEEYGALIEGRTPMRALPMPLSRPDVGVVTSAIASLPAQVSAALVIGLPEPATADVQRRLAEHAGPLVISEIDAVTAALAAAALTMLRTRGIPPPRARVVLADADATPLLAPILIACGIGELTAWRECDASEYPLHRLMEHNDILIDPDGAAKRLAPPRTTLSLPHDLFDYGALVVPGLLGALCGHGVAVLDIAHLGATALTLTALSATGKLLPELNAPRLLSAIARNVSLTVAQ